LTKAIQLKPDNTKTWRDRGYPLKSLKRYEEALESFDKSIQLNPNDAGTWFIRGLTLGDLKRYENAVESFDKAIQIKPDYAEAWVNRGIMLGRIGRHDEALISLKKGEEFAIAQNAEVIPAFTTMLLIETSLIDSFTNLSENNIGSAKNSLTNAIKYAEQVNEEISQQLIFGFLKSAIKTGKFEFLKEAIDTIVKELGEDYDGLLRPFRIALDYMQTKDVGILERLQQEEREIVQEIAGER
jgi:tetratricopeptide (TPR) repeat protein